MHKPKSKHKHNNAINLMLVYTSVKNILTFTTHIVVNTYRNSF